MRARSPWSGCRRRRSQAGAEGVVGVDLHEGSHNWQPHVIEFFAVGTAVTADRRQ